MLLENKQMTFHTVIQGAMNELETLRCRNADTSSRLEKAVEEAMHYRTQYQRSMGKMEELSSKHKSLQAKCEMWEEKYEEIVLLREQVGCFII